VVRSAIIIANQLFKFLKIVEADDDLVAKTLEGHVRVWRISADLYLGKYFVHIEVAVVFSDKGSWLFVRSKCRQRKIKFKILTIVILLVSMEDVADLGSGFDR
jgi:hypothetical protein